MARSYYSTVLDHSADEVWAVIRPFDHYAWAGVPSETVIEEGKRGDQVSAVRRVAVGDKIISLSILRHIEATPDERAAYLKRALAVRRGMSIDAAENALEAESEGESDLEGA